MNATPRAQTATAFRAFGLHQMPPACLGTQHFSTRRNLEPLGGGFFRLNAFGTSHKNQSGFYSKERAI
jgi:hypothetical protein